MVSRCGGRRSRAAIGVVELDDEAVDAVGAVEHHLRALQEHERLRLVVLRDAGAEDADDFHRRGRGCWARDTERAAERPG